MFDIQNYPSFVLAVLVFQLIPGAGTNILTIPNAQSTAPKAINRRVINFAKPVSSMGAVNSL